MVVAAARIDSRLVAAMKRLDDPRHPIAETNRRVGALAERLRLPRPSYERTRVLVHAFRRGSSSNEAVAQLGLGIAFCRRPPAAILELLLQRRRLQVTVCYLGNTGWRRDSSQVRCRRGLRRRRGAVSSVWAAVRAR